MTLPSQPKTLWRYQHCDLYLSLVLLAGVFLLINRYFLRFYVHMFITIALPAESVNSYLPINLHPISSAHHIKYILCLSSHPPSFTANTLAIWFFWLGWAHPMAVSTKGVLEKDLLPPASPQTGKSLEIICSSPLCSPQQWLWNWNIWTGNKSCLLLFAPCNISACNTQAFTENKTKQIRA